jgi:SAM-dependent methyltransferase
MTHDERSQSFGSNASGYERFRPGPPIELIEWMLPEGASTVVDLGAGTGGLSRLLIERVEEVIAVEPDDRMRGELATNLLGIRALSGQGESIPLPDQSADAVLASASWHWMDPIPTLHEVARVLVPHGTLGAVWAGPDPEGALLVQAKALLAGGSARNEGEATDENHHLDEGEFSSLIQGEGSRPEFGLTIPDGVPFDQPEHRTHSWDVALSADELIGLLGTFSWIIVMPEKSRLRLFNEARRILRELLGIEGEITVDVAFRAEAWRTRRQS